MATKTQENHIAELEAAYEKLIMGQSASVVVDSTGERIEYTKADLDRLERYIKKLKYEYGIRDVIGPMGGIF